jgi:hypothetical protein
MVATSAGDEMSGAKTAAMAGMTGWAAAAKREKRQAWRRHRRLAGGPRQHVPPRCLHALHTRGYVRITSLPGLLLRKALIPSHRSSSLPAAIA